MEQHTQNKEQKKDHAALRCFSRRSSLRSRSRSAPPFTRSFPRSLHFHRSVRIRSMRFTPPTLRPNARSIGTFAVRLVLDDDAVARSPHAIIRPSIAGVRCDTVTASSARIRIQRPTSTMEFEINSLFSDVSAGYCADVSVAKRYSVNQSTNAVQTLIVTQTATASALQYAGIDTAPTALERTVELQY